MATLPRIYRSSSPTVAVIGAGLIGLCCAVELTRRGAQVILYDKRQQTKGASWAAAGMLAPAFEAAAETDSHPRLLEFCLEGANHWAAFAEDVMARTQSPFGFNTGETLALALSKVSERQVATLREALTANGVPHDVLSGEEARAVEPRLGPMVRGALRLPEDGRVDNRAAMSRLQHIAEREPRLTFEREPAPLRQVGGQAHLEGADVIVLAAGHETPDMPIETATGTMRLGRLDPQVDLIRPVSGQALAVRLAKPLARTLRCRSVYVNPRGPFAIVGATVQEGRIDMPDPDVIQMLLSEATGLLPELRGAPVEEEWVGVRPGTPDDAPLIGPSTLGNLYVAAGHYRNGVLLAPITARLIADRILDGGVSDLAAAFSPSRFADAAS